MSNNVRLRIPFGHTLPQRRESRSAIGRWLLGVSDLHGSGDGAGQETHSWRRVLWLTGVDYFSTLGYQPGTPSSRPAPSHRWPRPSSSW